LLKAKKHIAPRRSLKHWDQMFFPFDRELKKLIKGPMGNSPAK
jgi:hypothetical protein